MQLRKLIGFLLGHIRYMLGSFGIFIGTAVGFIAFVIVNGGIVIGA